MCRSRSIVNGRGSERPKGRRILELMDKIERLGDKDKELAEKLQTLPKIEDCVMDMHTYQGGRWDEAIYSGMK